MTFKRDTYSNFIADASPAQQRLFRQYRGARSDFDIIIIGSGIGGGILADDLADTLATSQRVLVLEAGSYIFPTHVYNICRFDNGTVAQNFECGVFEQQAADGDGNQYYIHESPQLNLGGRSIFWSGLIPRVQDWELHFFPPSVKRDLTERRYLQTAGQKMNESITMGAAARQIVAELRKSTLNEHFDIQEAPRALHQSYLKRDGQVVDSLHLEPTGVFNTAELLINQAGLASASSEEADDQPSGFHLLLSHYVEDIQRGPGGAYNLVVRDIIGDKARLFQAKKVVLSGGSIESPKLLRRSSSLFNSLSAQVTSLVGSGLTDHPTTDELSAKITNINAVPIPRDAHAKITLYSRGRKDIGGQTRFPFNVELNVNHEYWHLRNNDPSADPVVPGPSRIDLKFSFANCIDEQNQIKAAPPYGYVPEIVFRNLQWTDHLRDRFNALAGWEKSDMEIFGVLNSVADEIFSQFEFNGGKAASDGNARYGKGNVDFGWGTVHHAVGTLRMPHRPRHDADYDFQAVVDEDLQVIGADNLYVCDMSVMPLASAANPVRTLAALALRLSTHLQKS